MPATLRQRLRELARIAGMAAPALAIIGINPAYHLFYTVSQAC
ncbi:MAG: hypothetical protein ACXWTS_04175 [Methylococcaceae bacterium]